MPWYIKSEKLGSWNVEKSAWGSEAEATMFTAEARMEYRLPFPIPEKTAWHWAPKKDK